MRHAATMSAEKTETENHRRPARRVMTIGWAVVDVVDDRLVVYALEQTPMAARFTALAHDGFLISNTVACVEVGPVIADLIARKRGAR